MYFDMLIGSTGTFIPSARGKGNDSLVDENQFHKFLKNAGFYLTARNLIVLLELGPGSRGCFLEFGKLEFPLDQTEDKLVWTSLFLLLFNDLSLPCGDFHPS